MKIRSTNLWRIAGMAVACLAVLSSHAAQAQVKLEYKFPEGKSSRSSRPRKRSRFLTLQGMEILTEQDNVVVTSRTAGKRRDDGRYRSRKRLNRYTPRCRSPAAST